MSRKRHPRYRPGYFCQAPGCKAPLLWERTTPAALKKGRGRFCSLTCAHSGKNNSNWKGGVESKTNQKCFLCDDFLTHAQVVRGGVYCSPTCRYEDLKGEKHACWTGGGTNRVCKGCGIIFKIRTARIKQGRGVFHSRECFLEWAKSGLAGENSPRWKGGDIECVCEICNKIFPCKRERVKQGWGKTCSTSCQGEWQSINRTGENSSTWAGGDIWIACPVCDKSFPRAKGHVRGNGRDVCSTACEGKRKSVTFAGQNAPNWQGGKSFEPYDAAFNDALKCQVRERDAYTCAICGVNGSRICHHIDYNKKNSVMDNLITLCMSCHGKTCTNRNYWQMALTEIMQAAGGDKNDRDFTGGAGTLGRSEDCSGAPVPARNG